MTIHWCGTGLSAIPGLRDLVTNGHDVTVWEIDPSKAQATVGDLTDRINLFDSAELELALRQGDIIVAMTPADQHIALAKLCIAHKAHFVSASYITPAMRALDDEAKEEGVRLVNEVGLDPGIDHVLAHHLVADYRASRAYDVRNEISFTSYCGGIPQVPNAFRYKFSWSPIGVLQALRTPSTSIKAFSHLHMRKPWEAVTQYTAPLAKPEEFEVYPNRDALPFIKEYRFGEGWKIKEFIRGSLRLNGWKDAWESVFSQLDNASDEDLSALSQELWAKYPYADGEADRVVLCVSLKAEHEAQLVYHKTYAVDAWGDARGSAMARLVSAPVALSVEAILKREVPVGVTAAPHDPKLVVRWLEMVDRMSQFDAMIDHLA